MTFKELVNGWDQGECKILHSRPRHPQTNGKVEQSNRTVEEMISAFKLQNNTNKWIQFLPKIMYNMNTQKHSATRKTPYQIFFGIRPNNATKILAIPDDLEESTGSNFQNLETQQSTVVESQQSTVVESQQSTVSETESPEHRESNILIIREKTRKRQAICADLSSKKHDRKRNKKTMTYEVGDYVSVKSPRIDRHGTDLPRIAAIIISKTSQYTRTFYELQTQFGILSDKYAADDLEPVPTPLIDLKSQAIQTKQISLREATMKTNNSAHSINTKLKCNCNGLCQNDNRCKCWQAKQK